jgi:hypothetical protein
LHVSGLKHWHGFIQALHREIAIVSFWLYKGHVSYRFEKEQVTAFQSDQILGGLCGLLGVVSDDVTINGF